MDEMIATVRAALTPAADAAIKQRAATILRGLLTMLEPGMQPGSIPELQADPVTSTSPPPVDVLGVILEAIKPHLPEQIIAEMPRFRVPLVGRKL